MATQPLGNQGSPNFSNTSSLPPYPEIYRPHGSVVRKLLPAGAKRVQLDTSVEVFAATGESRWSGGSRIILCYILAYYRLKSPYFNKTKHLWFPVPLLRIIVQASGKETRWYCPFPRRAPEPRRVIYSYFFGTSAASLIPGLSDSTSRAMGTSTKQGLGSPRLRTAHGTRKQPRSTEAMEASRYTRAATSYVLTKHHHRYLNVSIACATNVKPAPSEPAATSPTLGKFKFTVHSLKSRIQWVALLVDHGAGGKGGAALTAMAAAVTCLLALASKKHCATFFPSAGPQRRRLRLV
ncbi:hypothetical protein SELMODRAFT_411875 [Selaginella moellendorffii]|uniref:Uncharacterized protein n=1 Tax=Selaginella moellendorffii TaxID=88036 RepID=D8RJB2_SELML|nr:hypothetical protein SELMODRAFT_411875 [Selaginella moellendorffii]